MASNASVAGLARIRLVHWQGQWVATADVPDPLRVLVVASDFDTDCEAITQAIRQQVALFCADIRQAVDVIQRGFEPDVAIVDLRREIAKGELRSLQDCLAHREVAFVALHQGNLVHFPRVFRHEVASPASASEFETLLGHFEAFRGTIADDSRHQSSNNRGRKTTSVNGRWRYRRKSG